MKISAERCFFSAFLTFEVVGSEFLCFSTLGHSLLTVNGVLTYSE